MAYAYDLDNRIESREKFRDEEGIKSRRMFWYAAIICAARGAVMPWVLFTMPSMRSVTGLTDEIIVYSSIGLMLVFLFAAMIGRYFPIFASLIAIAGFSYFCYYDITHFKGVLEIGIFGKLALCVCVIRGAMSALLSRTI